jgi:hypothetical protein
MSNGRMSVLRADDLADMNGDSRCDVVVTKRYGVVGIILTVRSLDRLRGMNCQDAMERDIYQPLGIRNILPGGTGFSAGNMARIGVLLDNPSRYRQ